eukprot:s3790_g18.t1
MLSKRSIADVKGALALSLTLPCKSILFCLLCIPTNNTLGLCCQAAEIKIARVNCCKALECKGLLSLYLETR